MKPKIIVSLTSFPPRMGTVHKVIESILAQSVRPDKIVLYLADDQFPGRKLPKELTGLEKKNSIFEIRWWPRDIRSFKKLVPALQEFPDDIIITVDDDILYGRDTIKKLLETHEKYPRAICSRRCRRIRTGLCDVKKYGSFQKVRGARYRMFGRLPSYDNLLTGVGGTLYPPKALHGDVFRDDVFMKICPTTDDLWFWAMAVLRGTKTAPAGRSGKLNHLDSAMLESLDSQNNAGELLNDRYMENILDMYPAAKRRLLRTKYVKIGFYVFAVIFIAILIFFCCLNFSKML